MQVGIGAAQLVERDRLVGEDPIGSLARRRFGLGLVGRLRAGLRSGRRSLIDRGLQGIQVDVV